jgi:hypothetical protein
MIISSAAVIIICLIAHFSQKKGEILKATILVLIIKGVISPHTPFAAYLAVFLQGLLGEILFFNKRFYLLSCIILGLSVGILTGSQRIITYTLIFGGTFWEAINQFLSYVVKEFFLSSDVTSFNLSLFLIVSYILIHALFGFGSGVLGFKLPKKINSESMKGMLLSEQQLISNQIITANKNKRKRPWWKKPVYFLFFLIVGVLLVITYINPQGINLSQKSILIMIVRAILVTVIWFYFLSPILMMAIKKILNKRQSVYAYEISSIINHFPQYKNIAASIWKLSNKQKGLLRFGYFITALIANVLTLKIPD